MEKVRWEILYAGHALTTQKQERNHGTGPAFFMSASASKPSWSYAYPCRKWYIYMLREVCRATEVKRHAGGGGRRGKVDTETSSPGFRGGGGGRYYDMIRRSERDSFFFRSKPPARYKCRSLMQNLEKDGGGGG